MPIFPRLPNFDEAFLEAYTLSGESEDFPTPHAGRGGGQEHRVIVDIPPRSRKLGWKQRFQLCYRERGDLCCLVFRNAVAGCRISIQIFPKVCFLKDRLYHAHRLLHRSGVAHLLDESFTVVEDVRAFDGGDSEFLQWIGEKMIFHDAPHVTCEVAGDALAFAQQTAHVGISTPHEKRVVHTYATSALKDRPPLSQELPSPP